MLPTSRDNPFASSDPFAATTPMRDEVDQFESVDINAPGGLFSGTSAGELEGGTLAVRRPLPLTLLALL